jgi:hypothetical protein
MANPRFSVAAQSLVVDRYTGEVVAALRAADLEPLLLKGPATTGWLYRGEIGTRPYSDADLLVAPADCDTARRTLRELGFECDVPISMKAPLAKRRHGEDWRRARDDAVVDLHESVHYAEHLDPARVWRVLSRDADCIDVAGTPVSIPSVAVRALLVVLHLQPDDVPDSQAWRDLERAIDRVPMDTWWRAAALAAELGLTAETGTVLARVPGGRTLADELALPTDAPEVADWRGRDLSSRSWVDRMASNLFPPPGYLRAGWPFARRGPMHLAAAYVWRLVVLPWHGVAWWRSRRARD